MPPIPSKSGKTPITRLPATASVQGIRHPYLAGARVRDGGARRRERAGRGQPNSVLLVALLSSQTKHMRDQVLNLVFYILLVVAVLGGLDIREHCSARDEDG